MNSSGVKASRPYDSSSRRQRAHARRQAILDVAERHFLGSGYAVTTVARVAADAGVSVETVYKSFRGKAGLAKAVWARGLLGSGVTSAEERSDAASSTLEDPRAVIHRWTEIAQEVAPRVQPIALMIRAAAATDPEVAELWEQLRRQRLDRMGHNAQAIAGHLRPGLGVGHARDILLAYTSPELFELLVLQQGWSAADFAEFQRRGLEAALL